MSNRTLQIWRQAHHLALDIHIVSLSLPKFELYDRGSQIRRSSKLIRSNIVEDYGRRKYKADYLRFLNYAFASSFETDDHLESLFETRSLSDREKFDDLLSRNQTLGKKLNRSIKTIEKSHSEPGN